MRLIDADEAIRLVNEEFNGVCVYDVSASRVIDDFENIIDKTPTINSQGIVNEKLIEKLKSDISWLEQGCTTELEIVEHIKEAIERLKVIC